MHKKLATDLTSLAHSILQLKNKEDVRVLKQKAYEIYEKLTVLAYVDEYIENTPNATETKEELLEKIASAENNKEVTSLEEKTEEVEEVPVSAPEVVEEAKEETPVEVIDAPSLDFDNLEEEDLFSAVETSDNSTEEAVEEKKSITLEEELEDTISIDVAADLFEKPVVKKSLNNQIHQNLQIGLNDRIAFVKHLFNGNQGDFNRVVSQLNSFKTEKEARKFIKKMVKPDYNWAEQEEYETRFMEIVERRFL
ncbi:MAG: hypothetical protein P8K77_01730 [Polaribacter sp.]|nr:hypothetical protein [Polaribacter sp.]